MKVLVIIDMQNDFIDKSILGNKETYAIIPGIVYKITSRNYDRIIVTRDTHNSNYFHTQEGKNLPIFHCQENTYGWGLSKNIQMALKGCPVPVDYINKSSFGSLSLAVMIQELKPQEIELVGVCTGICVISNALIIKAVNPELLITVDSSCCACVTKESHQKALDIMELCQIHIIK